MKVMNLGRLVALSMAAACILVGCGGSTSNGIASNGGPGIRLVNSFPDVASIQGSAGGRSFIGTGTAGATPYGTASSLLWCLTGTSTLTVGDAANSSTSDLVSQSGLTFSNGNYYTAVAYGDSSARKVAIVQDNHSSAPIHEYGYRIINGTTTTVDVYVTLPGGALPATPTLSNVAAGAATDYQVASMGFISLYSQEFRVYATGTTTSPIADTSVGFGQMDRKTLVVITPPSGGTGKVLPLQD